MLSTRSVSVLTTIRLGARRIQAKQLSQNCQCYYLRSGLQQQYGRLSIPCPSKMRRHMLSSSATTVSSSPEDSNTTGKHTNISLRRLARPFIAAFHPDRQATDSTTIARDANLTAIQTLNGMIDTIEHLYDRAVDPGSTKDKIQGRGGRVDLEPRYTIEFLIPSSTEGAAPGVKKIKARDAPVFTRRSVDLIFTKSECESMQNFKHGSKKLTKSALAVKIKAMVEISKLLRVAGLSVPKDLGDELEELVLESKNTDEDSLMEDILHDELGLNNDNSAPLERNFTSSRSKTRYEESRERFLNKFRAEVPKLHKIYADAIEDNKRDLATQGYIEMNEERRQRMLSEVLSRIRVHNLPPTINGNDYKDEDGNDDGLSTIGQLIAIRRLSLLFNDNFEELRMEEMGRLWVKTCIVLTKQRQDIHSRQAGKPFSRRIKLKNGKESGFKFSYHADGKCTVYVPIDFTDDEILGEMKRHLTDFYCLCVADDELESFFPSYYKEFIA